MGALDGDMPVDEQGLDEAYLASLYRNQRFGLNRTIPRQADPGTGTDATWSDVGRGASALVQDMFSPGAIATRQQTAAAGLNIPEGARVVQTDLYPSGWGFEMPDGTIRDARDPEFQRHGGLFDLADLASMAGIQGGPRGTVGAGAGRMRPPAATAEEAAAVAGGRRAGESRVPSIRAEERAVDIERMPVDTTVTRAGSATPEEITASARRIDREGITQQGLRDEYQRLGLTGYEPYPEVRLSLGNPDAAELERAVRLKLDDRAYLNSLPPELRQAVFGGTREQAALRREHGLRLPSQEANAAQTAETERLAREIKRAERDVTRMRGQRNDPESGVMFDLSADRLRQLPDAPQFDLPRVQPVESERLSGIGGAGARRLREAAERANPQDAGWYNLEQIRDQFVQHHGPERGQRLYNTFLDYVAGTSMVNPIENNLRTASYYLGRTMRGEPLPLPVSVRDPQTGKVVQTLAAPPSAPYGAKSQIQHAQRSREFASGGIDPVDNPKPVSYRQNLGGNWQPITVDTHEIRNFVGRPRFGLFGEEGPGSLRAGEYAFIEDAGQRVSERMGLRPAMRQAATWTGGGEYTNLKSAPVPALRAFEDRVLITARVRGQTPEETLTAFIRDGVPLLSTGPNVPGMAARGLLGGDNEQ